MEQKKVLTKSNLVSIFALLSVILAAGFFYFENSLIGNAPTNIHPKAQINNSHVPDSSYTEDQETKLLKQELLINPNDMVSLKALAERLWTKLPEEEIPSSALVLDLLDTLTRLLNINPHDELSLLMMANLTFNQRVFDKSASYYEKYLALAPQDMDARASYSSTLTFLNRFDDSLRQIDMVLEKNPKSFQGNAYRSITLAQMGKLDEAKKVGQYTLTLAPSDEAKKRFGMFLASLDEKEESKTTADSRTAVVTIVKESSVAGPKFVVSNIRNGDILELIFQDFPMDKMPPIAKDVFFAKIKAANLSDKFKKIIFLDKKSGSKMSEIDITG